MFVTFPAHDGKAAQSPPGSVSTNPERSPWAEGEPWQWQGGLRAPVGWLLQQELCVGAPGAVPCRAALPKLTGKLMLTYTQVQAIRGLTVLVRRSQSSCP